MFDQPGKLVSEGKGPFEEIVRKQPEKAWKKKS